MSFEEMYDILSDYIGIDIAALDLAFAIGGRDRFTAEKILFYCTGHSNFKAFLEEVREEG